MCRHLAYLGPPRTLSSVLLDPPHGLLQQAWAPTEMCGGGTINVDGFGVGWYPDGPGGAPVRVRSDRPIWSDTSFASLAAATPSTGVLGAVRAASPGMPVVSTANAPFTADGWLFSHNGFALGWPETLADLAATLPVTDLMTLDAPTDASLIWAVVRNRLRAGDDPADVLAETARGVDATAPGSRLNFLLTDGATVWATAWRHALSVHVDAASVTVASEPTDPLPAWTRVPDRHLVVARKGYSEMHPLTGTEVAPSGAAVIREGTR